MKSLKPKGPDTINVLPGYFGNYQKREKNNERKGGTHAKSQYIINSERK